jgi:MFS family permease
MIFAMRSPIAYFIIFGITSSAATMMMGQLSVQSTVSEWFVRRRGIAMTIMMFIGASAGLFIPLGVNAVINASGGAWQAGWYVLAGLSLLMLPVPLLLVRNRPADIGQQPDGGDSAKGAEKAKPAYVFKNKESVPFKKVLRTPALWLISLAATGGFAAYSLAVSQGIIHFGTLGLERSSLVGAVAVMGVSALCGKTCIGALADRFEPVRMIACAVLLIAVGITVAIFTTNIYMAYLFYILLGFGFGAVNATFPTCMANYFGVGSMSKNLGTGILITTLVASTLPALSGAIYDATGYCTIAFWIAIGILIICAACGFLVRIPRVAQQS